MKRPVSVVALAVAGLLVSGCTLVPTARTPAVIGPHAVPFGLLGKTIPGTNNGRVRFITQPVYIVDATGHLTPSSRVVPAPPSLDSVLRELVIGPTGIESFAGFTSALPKKLVILQAVVRNKVGFVSLTSSLDSLPLSQQILAIGQLVYTAYDVGATNGFEILVAGVAQRLPLPNDTKARRVTTSDYQRLLNT